MTKLEETMHVEVKTVTTPSPPRPPSRIGKALRCFYVSLSAPFVRRRMPEAGWAQGRELPQTPPGLGAARNNASPFPGRTVVCDKDDLQKESMEIAADKEGGSGLEDGGADFIAVIAAGFDELYDENKMLKAELVNVKAELAECIVQYTLELVSVKAELVNVKAQFQNVNNRLIELEKMYKDNNGKG